MSIHVITSFYTSKNPIRNAELEKTLLQNIQSEHIERIHLFVDDDVSWEKLNKEKFVSAKIVRNKLGKQPLYSDLFAYANTLVGKVCMITNSDIWLHSIEDSRLLHSKDPNVIYSLTRYEADMSCHLIDEYSGSHDVFIFHSPVKKSIIKHLQFPQNVWGSENVVLYELRKLNYTLLNPCKQIKTVHEHSSNERNENRIRINRGDKNGDGVFSVRSHVVAPCIIRYK